MKKEKIYVEAVKQDLKKVVECRILDESDRRLAYIMPLTLLSLVVGIVTGSIFIGLAVFAIDLCYIILFYREWKEHKKMLGLLENAIERGDFSVTVEKLSHISDGSPYGRSRGMKRVYKTRIERVFYFKAGGSWTVPLTSRHYAWSQEYSFSSSGLENVSLVGDELYRIALKDHPYIDYIYPGKYFELDSSMNELLTDVDG